MALEKSVGTWVRIEGDGLVLREWTAEDLGILPELFDEPEIDRWTPIESGFDLAAAVRYLQQAAERRADGSALHLAITEDGVRPLGEVLLFDTGGGTAEFGYAVGAAFRGRALASRAVLLFLRHAADWGFTRFRLRIEPGNAASEAVARAAGFSISPLPTLPVETKGRRVELAVWQRGV
jgi:RimJ/RimL family protein N-acetyltransferase